MNYIGKMYRPTEIYSLQDKRGLEFHHKYKSNFGPKHSFSQQVFLYFDQDDKETICIEMMDLEVDVLLDASYFQKIDEHTATSKNERRSVTSLRNILRPADKKMSSKKETLVGEMVIDSERDRNEKLTFEIKPVIVDNKEYLHFIFTAKTQIQVTVNTSLKVIKG